MRRVLVVVMALVAVAAIYVATRPGSFHVVRETTIAAPSSVVFDQIDDFHAWPAWSPWEKLDPQMKKTFDGADRGVGAVYHWDGNQQVGEGRMTITSSEPGRSVVIRLEFLKPWTATNSTAFELTPTAEGTRVAWSMEGKNNFVAKAMSLFLDMDEMIGKDFEEGLANLKDIAESDAPPDTSSMDSM